MAISPHASPDESASNLDGAFVVVGVTGSIAAYKAVEICRRLMDGGAYVVPIVTKAATAFIGTATFSALCSEPAQTELFSTREPIAHTRLGRSADLVVVAPATANIIAKYARGLSSDLLSATLLCTTAPVLLCPAMHTEMWEHQALQENLATLRGRGVEVVEPESGRLAGGDIGQGRLASVESIVERAEILLERRGDLSGVEVLVTAGGTREPIDPVRFVANRSSGKQGYAIAAAASRRGASVTLVSTSDLPAPRGVTLIAAETADDVDAAVRKVAPSAQVVVMAAAIADFRPARIATEKLKRADGLPTIVFEKTPDILAGLCEQRRPGQIIVGFAAETTESEAHGRDKLAKKGLDAIVINDVSEPGVGFGHDTNAVTILSRDGGRIEVAMAPKSTIADAVLDEVVRLRVR